MEASNYVNRDVECGLYVNVRGKEYGLVHLS